MAKMPKDNSNESVRKTVIEQVFDLRHNFVLIGLTGRTGSGCSTIAEFLSRSDFAHLKSNYREKNQGNITNETRKDTIVYNYIQENWKQPFTVISASDVIFYYILLAGFDTFKNALLDKSDKFDVHENSSSSENAELEKRIDNIKDYYEELHQNALRCEDYIKENGEYDADRVNECKKLILKEIKKFRKKLDKTIGSLSNKIISAKLQDWGNNIRKYDSITEQENPAIGPSCLAHKINRIIKKFREYDKKEGKPTRIVIDALRNPFEVLYFRERYAAFYLMAIHTEEKIRENKLYNKGYCKDEVEKIDKKEGGKKDFDDSYLKLDIDKCIELADIHLTHDGTDKDSNRDLVNQLFTYVTLIFHPGLIPPTPLERAMQVAYTAKLNSGCLSRQVGAAVTNEFYSVQSIGWNTVAEGQVPCSLRNLYNLCRREDELAYSNFEVYDKNFSRNTSFLLKKYKRKPQMKGVNISYCFKDIYTSTTEDQNCNQVHTRSLHAEENAFLQLAKYGTQGIRGGKLFTTASCCELCAKKAYQLGIREIYYIDTYPGISKPHILESGVNRPKMILFRGAIGRAYINLYSPFLPLKDEVEKLSGVKVKTVLSEAEKKRKQNGDNNTND